jgi:hypothetical protein
MVAAARQDDMAAASAGAGREGSWKETPFADLDEDSAPEPRRGRTERSRFRWLAKAAGMDTTLDRWAWLSPYHALGVVQAWIFGIETRSAAVVPCLVSLAGVSILAVFVLFNRIDAPTRA